VLVQLSREATLNKIQILSKYQFSLNVKILSRVGGVFETKITGSSSDEWNFCVLLQLHS
jgi:hypothetical protein